ncbi:hypothetical protein RUM44_001967 [Polyplax serrata]|uniref:Uncharacterized protein n=1 Tax=Polyplax serrata TaxID=468196 RepID=A0ABR1ALK0_POLSC
MSLPPGNHLVLLESASMGQKSQDEFEHEKKALDEVLKYLGRRGARLWSFRRERRFSHEQVEYSIRRV